VKTCLKYFYTVRVHYHLVKHVPLVDNSFGKEVETDRPFSDIRLHFFSASVLQHCLVNFIVRYDLWFVQNTGTVGTFIQREVE